MLTKTESRKRWQELKDLWNEFDPLGVMDYEEWPDDEYESYCGPCMRILESNEPASELESYVLRIVHDHMGMDIDKSKIQVFVEKMRTWHKKNWSNL